jgi:predicted glycogen debranching enzyme
MATARDLYPTFVDVITRHVEGTRYGIGVDPTDGLLRAGEEGVQLTWMDAKAGDWVVTPRTGKPVEINALWIKALRVMMRLEASLAGEQQAKGKEPPDYKLLARQAQASFRRRFWYEQGGYLYDVVDGPDGDDRSLRPNQLLAISLTPGLVSKPQAEKVLNAVRRYLLTPYGLRTLSPDDPSYVAHYRGDREARDGAYHQGTVWPWLLGPYLDAVLAVEGEEPARAELMRLMPALREHLTDAGLGSISEIFDAEPPHEPKGCISQAWSVAEVLRFVWGPGSLLAGSR